MPCNGVDRNLLLPAITYPTSLHDGAPLQCGNQSSGGQRSVSGFNSNVFYSHDEFNTLQVTGWHYPALSVEPKKGNIDTVKWWKQVTV